MAQRRPPRGTPPGLTSTPTPGRPRLPPHGSTAAVPRSHPPAPRGPGTRRARCCRRPLRSPPAPSRFNWRFSRLPPVPPPLHDQSGESIGVKLSGIKYQSSPSGSAALPSSGATAAPKPCPCPRASPCPEPAGSPSFHLSDIHRGGEKPFREPVRRTSRPPPDTPGPTLPVPKPPRRSQPRVWVSRDPNPGPGPPPAAAGASVSPPSSSSIPPKSPKRGQRPSVGTKRLRLSVWLLPARPARVPKG